MISAFLLKVIKFNLSGEQIVRKKEGIANSINAMPMW